VKVMLNPMAVVGDDHAVMSNRVFLMSWLMTLMNPLEFAAYGVKEIG
jgi:hypothetical protein